MTLWEACQYMLKNEELKGRSAKVIQNFVTIIDQMEDDSSHLDLDQ